MQKRTLYTLPPIGMWFEDVYQVEWQLAVEGTTTLPSLEAVIRIGENGEVEMTMKQKVDFNDHSEKKDCEISPHYIHQCEGCDP